MPDNEISSEVRVDPLGEVTRRERRNLLAVSVFGIVFNAFNVHLQELEAAGSKFQMDPQALPFLLITSGAYFVITFCLYYYHDIKNWAKPGHVENSRRAARNRLDNWFFGCIHQKETWIGKFFSTDRIIVRHNEARSLHDCYEEFLDSGYIPISTYFSIEKPVGEYPEDEMNEISNNISIHLKHWFCSFRRRERANKFIYMTPYWAVLSSYIFRYFIWELFLPLALAFYAGMVLLGYCDAGWIRDVVHLPTNSNVP